MCVCACKCQIDQIALSWQINWNIVGQTTIQSMDCLESPRIIKVDLWLCMTCPFFDMAKDIYTKTKWYQMIYFNYPYFFVHRNMFFQSVFAGPNLYVQKTFESTIAAMTSFALFKGLSRLGRHRNSRGWSSSCGPNAGASWRGPGSRNQNQVLSWWFMHDMAWV
jgi:hypothetical protein